MATKLDFFFEVFSALLAGAHSPEKGGGGGGGGDGGSSEGGSTEETAAAAAAAAQARQGCGEEGEWGDGWMGYGEGGSEKEEKRRETGREYREGRGDSDERRPGKPIIRIENSQWPCI